MTSSSNSSPEGLSVETVRCPKCNGGMVQGFIADFQGSKFCRVSTWVEGAPDKPTWFGTCVPTPAEKSVPGGTYRCSTCGFLESYARPEFAAK